MARARRPEGPCCLCGTVGPLSFEHVPPQSAFNDSSVFLAEVKRLVGRDWWATSNDELPGRTQQRGAGQYTLCERCNNKTGEWYVSDYARLAKAAMPALSIARAGDVAGIAADIRPLRVLKQILVMFCSACGPNFVFPELARYLLNRESRKLPQGHDIHLGLFDRTSRLSRQAGLTGSLDLASAGQRSYSEISFPPLLLVMTVDSPSPDTRLLPVAWFNRYGWDERWQGMLKLPCLQVNTHLPGTYATREEIEANRARRLEEMAASPPAVVP